MEEENVEDLDGSAKKKILYKLKMQKLIKVWSTNGEGENFFKKYKKQ